MEKLLKYQHSCEQTDANKKNSGTKQRNVTRNVDLTAIPIFCDFSFCKYSKTQHHSRKATYSENEIHTYTCLFVAFIHSSLDNQCLNPPSSVWLTVARPLEPTPKKNLCQFVKKQDNLERLHTKCPCVWWVLVLWNQNTE